MWMAMAVVLAFLLLFSWGLFSMLLSLTALGRSWRQRNRMFASWAGVVLAMGTFLVAPELFPGPLAVQWPCVAALAMLVAQICWLIQLQIVNRMMQRVHEYQERKLKERQHKST